MRKDNMNKLTIDDLEQDQQEILDKSDIKTLSHYCLQLQNYQDQIDNLEQDLKSVKEQADKISSEIIPNLLAEQGLSSLKLADGSAVEVKKSYSCTVKKDADFGCCGSSTSKSIIRAYVTASPLIILPSFRLGIGFFARGIASAAV